MNHELIITENIKNDVYINAFFMFVQNLYNTQEEKLTLISLQTMLCNFEEQFTSYKQLSHVK